MSESPVLLTPGYNIISDESFQSACESLNEATQVISDHIHHNIKNLGKARQNQGHQKPYKGFLGGHTGRGNRS